MLGRCDLDSSLVARSFVYSYGYEPMPTLKFILMRGGWLACLRLCRQLGMNCSRNSLSALTLVSCVAC